MRRSSFAAVASLVTKSGKDTNEKEARFFDREAPIRAKGQKEKMLQEYKTKTNLFILLGIVVQIIGVIVGQDIGLLIRLGGSILFIVGCCYYAKGKGYHGAWGLLGLLSLLGLIVLVCMRDRHKA